MSSSSVVSRDAGKTPAPILSAPLDDEAIERAREIVRRALHAADNANHEGEMAVLPHYALDVSARIYGAEHRLRWRSWAPRRATPGCK